MKHHRWPEENIYRTTARPKRSGSRLQCLWFSLGLLCLLGLSTTAVAQHPQELEALVSQQRFYEVAVTSRQLARRRITDRQDLAIARSEWALSLPQAAAARFAAIAESPILTQQEREEAFLAQVVIALQEENFQKVVELVDRMSQTSGLSSEAQSKAQLLQGEALLRLEETERACTILATSLESLPVPQKGDAALLLGKCERLNGRLNEARTSFELVPIDHPGAGEAVHNLIQIALQQRDIKRTRYWVQKGREQFPEVVAESWTRYILGLLAISEQDVGSLSELLREGEKTASPSDHWYLLLQAAAEAFLFVKGRSGL